MNSLSSQTKGSSARTFSFDFVGGNDCLDFDKLLIEIGLLAYKSKRTRSDFAKKLLDGKLPPSSTTNRCLCPKIKSGIKWLFFIEFWL